MAFFDTFKKIGSGIASGFSNALQGDFSGLQKTTQRFNSNLNVGLSPLAAAGSAIGDAGKDLRTGSLTGELIPGALQQRQQNVAERVRKDLSVFRQQTLAPGGGRAFSGPIQPGTNAGTFRNTGRSVRSALPSSGSVQGASSGGSRRKIRAQKNIPAPTAVGGRSNVQSFGGQSQAQAPATAGGGGSAFTGLLGAASGLFGPNVAEASDEDPRFTELRNSGAVTGGSFSPALQQAILGVQGGPQSQLREGPVQAGAQGLTPPPSDRLNANLPSEIPADSLTSQPSANFTSLIGSGQVTRQQFKLEAENLAAKIRQELEAKQPTPQEPIVDDQAQLEFIESSDDPFGVAQAIDDYKRANTNLFELETERINLKKDIQAIQESYRSITKDIKDNPDLPKGLAQRRLAQLNEQQGEALLGFVNQLELLDDQVQSENELVNRQFNLITTLQQQERQSSQDAFQRLQFILDAGATVSDDSLRDLSERAGVDFNSAKSVLEQAQEENKPANLDGLRSTTIGGFELLTDAEGNVIKTQKVSKSKGDAQFTPGEKRTINRLPQLKQFSPDFQGLLFESLTDAEISEFVKFYEGKKTTSEGAGLSPSPSIALDEFIITKEFSDPFDRLLNEARGGLK